MVSSLKIVVFFLPLQSNFVRGVVLERMCDWQDAKLRDLDKDANQALHSVKPFSINILNSCAEVFNHEDKLLTDLWHFGSQIIVESRQIYRRSR